MREGQKLKRSTRRPRIEEMCNTRGPKVEDQHNARGPRIED